MSWTMPTRYSGGWVEAWSAQPLPPHLGDSPMALTAWGGWSQHPLPSLVSGLSAVENTLNNVPSILDYSHKIYIRWLHSCRHCWPGYFAFMAALKMMITICSLVINDLAAKFLFSLLWKRYAIPSSVVRYTCWLIFTVHRLPPSPQGID